MSGKGRPIKFDKSSKSAGAGLPKVTGVYDEATGSVQYLVTDPETNKGALIDVVLGSDPKNASTDTTAMDAILEYAKRDGVEIEWILDTHLHADHLCPGHTDAAFVHDTLMQPDVGTARADFPGGSSATLYGALQDILAPPDETRLFVGHDYGTDSRTAPAWESTVAEQRKDNKHIGGGISERDYVALREKRDKHCPCQTACCVFCK